MLDRNVDFFVSYTLIQLSFSTKNQAAIFRPPGVWLHLEEQMHMSLHNTVHLPVQLQIRACILFGKYKGIDIGLSLTRLIRKDCQNVKL